MWHPRFDLAKEANLDRFLASGKEAVTTQRLLLTTRSPSSS